MDGQITDKNFDAEALPRVLVMMATYNGAAWVKAQLDSILAQEGVDVRVRVCDDRSTDNTFAVLEDYARLHAGVHVTQNEHNLGVAWNFMQMVYEDESRGFDYYAFSDQDDVWFPNKLARAVSEMRRTHGSDEPVLYYADIVNMGEGGETPEISLFAECEDHPGTVMVRNYINGCAMVWNAPLQRLASMYRPASLDRIHDVWMHMLGRFCGSVVADLGFVSMQRRITGHNVVGAQVTNVHGIAGLVELVRLALPPYERPACKTARVFYAGYHDHLNDVGERVFGSFLAYADSFAGRLRIIGNKDYWMPTAQMRLRMAIGFLLGFY